jgi:hypothetical protein
MVFFFVVALGVLFLIIVSLIYHKIRQKQLRENRVYLSELQQQPIQQEQFVEDDNRVRDFNDA